MTTEDDFQKRLDAQIDDHQTRMVFADWLQERGDPRAEGYRALGLHGIYPIDGAFGAWYTQFALGMAHDQLHAVLPVQWFERIELRGRSDFHAPDHRYRTECSRRELDDAVALAFSKLDESVRNLILKGR